VLRFSNTQKSNFINFCVDIFPSFLLESKNFDVIMEFIIGRSIIEEHRKLSHKVAIMCQVSI